MPSLMANVMYLDTYMNVRSVLGRREKLISMLRPDSVALHDGTLAGKNELVIQPVFLANGALRAILMMPSWGASEPASQARPDPSTRLAVSNIR